MDDVNQILGRVIAECGLVLTRSVMETNSLNFADLSDKVSADLIMSAMSFFKINDKNMFNKYVVDANYYLLGRLNKPYEFIK